MKYNDMKPGDVGMVPLHVLTPDPRNARLHSERNIEAISASLRKFGQQKPIVVTPTGVVIAGNGQLEAARREGWKEIRVVVTALTGGDLAAYAIADNKTSDLAEWDYEVLAGLLEAMSEEDRALTGFSDFEIEPLLQAEWKPPAPADIPMHTGHGHSVHFNDDQWTVVTTAVDTMEGVENVPAALTELCRARIDGA